MTDFIETMKPIQAGKETNEEKETGVYTITIDQAKIGGLMVTIVILMIHPSSLLRLEKQVSISSVLSFNLPYTGLACFCMEQVASFNFRRKKQRN